MKRDRHQIVNVTALVILALLVIMAAHAISPLPRHDQGCLQPNTVPASWFGRCDR